MRSVWPHKLLGFTLILEFFRSKKFRMSSHPLRGFTLIELLVVIAVLSVLMTAVLSAINPVEQIKKANDSRKKSDAAEFLAASDRYYATFQCYPWQMAGSACNATNLNGAVALSTMDDAAAGGGTFASGLSEMLAKKELKKEFLDRSGFDQVFASQDTDGLVHVCFVPESQTFKALAITRGLQRSATSGCVPAEAGNVATACHTCLPE